MPLSTDKIPNMPLTGPELATYVAAMLTDELQQRSVPDAVITEMRASLALGCDNDFFFAYGTSYPRVKIQLKVRLHYRGESAGLAAGASAFSIEPSFEIQNPLAPKQAVIVRSVAPPLKDRGEDEHVECFTLWVVAENPNLIRIHYGIPIIQVNKIPPSPGQMFPEFKREEIEVTPSDYPEPQAPEVKDESEEFESAWGVAPSIAMAAPDPSVAPVPALDNLNAAQPDSSRAVHGAKRRGRPKGQK